MRISTTPTGDMLGSIAPLPSFHMILTVRDYAHNTDSTADGKGVVLLVKHGPRWCIAHPDRLQCLPETAKAEHVLRAGLEHALNLAGKSRQRDAGFMHNCDHEIRAELVVLDTTINHEGTWRLKNSGETFEEKRRLTARMAHEMGELLAACYFGAPE